MQLPDPKKCGAKEIAVALPEDRQDTANISHYCLLPCLFPEKEALKAWYRRNREVWTCSGKTTGTGTEAAGTALQLGSVHGSRE